MGDIQQWEMDEATCYGGAGDFPGGAAYPTGVGGKTNIVNQNEREILDDSFDMTPVTHDPRYGMEDDSHCVGVYRRADVAGS